MADRDKQNKNKTKSQKVNNLRDIKSLLQEEYVERTIITEYSVIEYDYYNQCKAIELFRYKSEKYNEYMEVICNKFASIQYPTEVTKTVQDIERICQEMMKNSLSPVQALLYGIRKCEDMLQQRYYDVSGPVVNLIVQFVKYNRSHKVDLIWCILNWIWKYPFMICISIAKQISDYEVNLAIYKRFYDEKFQNNRDNITYDRIPCNSINMENITLNGSQYDITKLLVNDKQNDFFDQILYIMKNLDSNSEQDKTIIHELISNYYKGLEESKKKRVALDLAETFNGRVILYLIKFSADKVATKDGEFLPNKIKLYLNEKFVKQEQRLKYMKQMKELMNDPAIREEMAGYMSLVYRSTEGIPELALTILKRDKDLTIKSRKRLILCLRHFIKPKDVKEACDFVYPYTQDDDCRDVALATLFMLDQEEYLGQLVDQLLTAQSFDYFKDAEYALKQINIKRNSIKPVRYKLYERLKLLLIQDQDIEIIVYNCCAYCDNEELILDDKLMYLLLRLFQINSTQEEQVHRKYSVMVYCKILNTLQRYIILNKNADKFISFFYNASQCFQQDEIVSDKLMSIITDPRVWTSSSLELIEGEE